jgi:hypothetical protein
MLAPFRPTQGPPTGLGTYPAADAYLRRP